MSKIEIACPNCNHSFPLQQVLAKEYEDTIRTEMREKWKIEQDKLAIEKAKNKEKETELQNKIADVENLVKQKTQESILAKEAELKLKLNDQFSEIITNLKKERDEDLEKIKSLQAFQIENERLKRMHDEQVRLIQLNAEKTITESLKAKENQLTEIVKKENEKELTSKNLKIQEQQTQMESLRKQVEVLQQKANQGSMQLQGEAQELLIEQELKRMFPFDIIEEIQKGKKGADCIQTVRNNQMQICGKIAWESKRTAHFNKEWIDKLKADMLLEKADIAILITTALPEKETRKVFEIDGIWVCEFSYFNSLAAIFRERLLIVFKVYQSQQGKGDKMNMLYNYLMSNEFKMQMNAIFDGFTTLKEGYEDEKKAMLRLWSKREKQLDNILMNSQNFVGALEGIVGSSFIGLENLGDSIYLNDAE